MLVCTFDLEPWWVLVPPVVSRADWARLPDRSAEPLARFLDLCDATHSRATFFVVGSYARTFPRRIREIADRGHEIGCHSLFHDDLAAQSIDDFARETAEAKQVLEECSGQSVAAFRAPSFSVPVQALSEFFQALAGMGFRVDSSLSSAVRVYGGVRSLPDVGRVFSLREQLGVDMIEVGVPGVRIFGRELTIFGGGYLRMTPTSFALAALRRQDYTVMYLHAHDFDKGSPRVPGATTAQQLRRSLRMGDMYSRVESLLTLKRGQTCAAAAAALTIA